MYICSNRHKFSEPKMEEQYLAQVGLQDVYEKVGVCPECGDDNIEEYCPCNYCLHKDVCSECSDDTGDCDDFWDEQDYYDLKKDAEKYHSLWMELQNKLYKENRDMWETMYQMEKDYDKERRNKCS